MKQYKILFLLSLFLVFSACKKDDDGDNDQSFDGSIEDIESFYNSDVVDALIDLGFEINTGNNPPTIEGSYLCTPSILEATSVPNDVIGSQFPDLFLNFRNQDNSTLTIDFDGASGSETYDGAGSFVSGSDDQFSVFLIITVTRDGETAEVTFAISGTKEADGIANLQVALIMIDDNGDPGGFFIENNTGRVLTDGDDFSEEL
ncbi:hypothetical protein [Patiriisocius hiemis]|uniref:Uncharacterized protein n=1 Tax=Patiriisocius hiemis TaxID=3075604 RepID=A0ABU2YFI6_9FLAO|nr:hypothetical protein [Constantimarinum sp. W242]MDT0556782.1 hypothetical protein [Constantimarinum sp. W242]